MQLEIVAKVSGKAYNRGENMGQKEKLIKKLMSKPKDFTFTEAETLLNYFDYVRSNKGKTSGSRVIFIFLARRFLPLKWKMNGGSLNLRKQLIANKWYICYN